jgi:hypothetical protein
MTRSHRLLAASAVFVSALALLAPLVVEAEPKTAESPPAQSAPEAKATKKDPPKPQAKKPKVKKFLSVSSFGGY